MKYFKNTKGIKVYIAILIALSLIFASCNKTIDTRAKTHVTQKKAPAENNEAVTGDCKDFKGDYTTDRYYKQDDAAIRFHELKCAYDAKVDLKTLVNKEKDNILHLAAYKADLDSVKFLIETVKTEVDVKDADSNTPLISAAASASSNALTLKVVTYLVEKGANVNAQSRAYTPLISAAESRQVKVVEYLISKGADPKISLGRTACDFAKRDPVNQQALLAALKNCS